MTNLVVPRGCKVTGIVTDRKDFYHQASATYERACQNAVPSATSLPSFLGTHAYLEYVERKHSSRSREDVGDLFGKKQRSVLGWSQRRRSIQPSDLFCRGTTWEEFALSAHASLLQASGLLRSENRVEGGKPFCFPPFLGAWSLMTTLPCPLRKLAPLLLIPKPSKLWMSQEEHMKRRMSWARRRRMFQAPPI